MMEAESASLGKDQALIEQARALLDAAISSVRAAPGVRELSPTEAIQAGICVIVQSLVVAAVQDNDHNGEEIKCALLGIGLGAGAFVAQATSKMNPILRVVGIQQMMGDVTAGLSVALETVYRMGE